MPTASSTRSIRKLGPIVRARFNCLSASTTNDELCTLNSSPICMREKNTIRIEKYSSSFASLDRNKTIKQQKINSLHEKNITFAKRKTL